MILAALNMLALVLWFFLARVTLYEVSDKLDLGRDGRVNAEFSSEAMGRIQAGQAAIIRINPGPEQPGLNLPALVVNVDQKGNRAQLLIMSPDLSPQTLGEKINGQVQVEVEYVTPAEMVLRSSGKYLSENQVPVSPQNLKDQGNQ